VKETNALLHYARVVDMFCSSEDFCVRERKL